MQPPQTLEFRDYYSGVIRSDGKMYIQIPLNFRHHFNSVSISYFKGTIFGVNGLVKYTNSSSSTGLTYFMHSSFTRDVGLYHNHIVITCTPLSFAFNNASLSFSVSFIYPSVNINITFPSAFLLN